MGSRKQTGHKQSLRQWYTRQIKNMLNGDRRQLKKAVTDEIIPGTDMLAQ